MLGPRAGLSRVPETNALGRYNGDICQRGKTTCIWFGEVSTFQPSFQFLVEAQLQGPDTTLLSASAAMDPQAFVFLVCH